MNADTILANPDIIRLESFISEPNASYDSYPLKAETAPLPELSSAVASVCTVITGEQSLTSPGTTWLSNFN